ncbi:MAG TPA: hypothetical protein VGR37_05750 [Longimicrobiaceae bacterium]|nr:hypothetical protein [Longimicrobiaceae bacterium]
MTPDEELDVARVWLRYATDGRAEDFWAWDRLATLVVDQPEQAWPILLRIIADAPEDQLGNVGAGPLENLLSEHATALGERVEEQARRSSRFRSALSSVWLSHGEVPPPLQERLQHLTGGRIRIPGSQP